ncbi:MAG TPA: NAD(P)H-binding protein [Steroidobacteraceae bacterium]|nr:NAD(P)H-binding protein [Steroidobacteraceae bacterium]
MPTLTILIVGGSGFIGRRLADSLRAAGHTVMATTRREADFTRDLDPAAWAPKLSGVDAVINAVGILREHGEQTFERVHERGPQALFSACASAGVRRVVQISALGAEHGATGYFRSKRRADEYLMRLPLNWTIVQPSLVFGVGGTSARLFTMMASLPIVALPGSGQQQVQPIHIEDLVQAIGAIVQRDDFARRRVSLVGPQALTLREFLARLRRVLGMPPARFIPIPLSFMRVIAAIAQFIPRSLLDRESLIMLEAGNTADPADTTGLLGRAPRPVDQFVTRDQRQLVAEHAQLEWLLPILRWSIALVWIWTGIVSLGLYPRVESLALLARTGLTGALAEVALYGAAALDLFFGAATLLMRRRQWLWIAQFALILAYTVIITIRLPEFWLHPYGPILKNLPLLACIALLYRLEAGRWNM